MLKSVVVYCGANRGFNTIYKEAAEEVGALLAKQHTKVVYGGGNMGLMGAVANAALQDGGSVVGIIPNFLAKLEIAHQTLSEMVFVETMHERKAHMVSLSSGVIALPGGYGTLDELFEILTWSQLRIFHGPIGILNTNGFYDHLLAQMDKMMEEGFLHPETRKIPIIASTPVELLARMNEAALVVENKELDNSLFVQIPPSE
jgi:hypothetical protein